MMNRKLTQYLIDMANKLQIPYQIAVRKSGGTDARAIHLHGAGVPTAVLGVPARYIHTHNGIIHLEDYLTTLKLVVEFLRTLDVETVNNFTAFIK